MSSARGVGSVFMRQVEHSGADAVIVNVEDLVGAPVGMRLVIVEDHDLIARVLAETLRTRGIDVEVTAPMGPDALLALVERTAPDLVLHDLDLGALGDGTEHVRRLAEAGQRILMVTGVTDPVRRGRCIEAGAIGIVDKGQSFDELVTAIGRVLDGRPPMDPRERDTYLAALRHHRHEQRHRLDRFDQLTGREAEVLAELVAGNTVADIATTFTVSVTTVRSHVRAVLSKLGVRSQLAAVGMARERGWRPPAP